MCLNQGANAQICGKVGRSNECLVACAGYMTRGYLHCSVKVYHH